MYLMGLDNGGTAIKCVIYDECGRECGVGSASVPLILPAPEMTERDPDLVWKGNRSAIRQALHQAGIKGSDVRAIGLTGYGNGVCLVDSTGKCVYNCIVSTDNRTSHYLEEWQANGVEDRVYQATYQKLWAAQPAALLPWFRDHAPEVLEKAAYVLSIKDYIRFKLTGEICAEITDASSGCLMNIKTCQYDKNIFQLLGIPDCLRLMPPFLGSTDITGAITCAAAEETGLAAGIPVSGGYFDIDAGALASGLLDDRGLCLIAGTWSINEYITQDLESGYGKFSNTIGYLPGFYVVEDSSPTSASNLDWFLRAGGMGAQQDSSSMYEVCNRLLENLPPEETGALFVPYLYASSTHPNSKGAFLNLSGYHTQAHLLRAVYEGVACSTLFHVNRLTNGAWSSYQYARFSGGASRSPVWSQMFADFLQIPIEVLRGTQLSSMGAAMSAGISIGCFKNETEAVQAMTHVARRYEPDPTRKEIYQSKYVQFEKALTCLSTFHSA